MILSLFKATINYQLTKRHNQKITSPANHLWGSCWSDLMGMIKWLMPRLHVCKILKSHILFKGLEPFRRSSYDFSFYFSLILLNKVSASSLSALLQNAWHSVPWLLLKLLVGHTHWRVLCIQTDLTLQLIQLGMFRAVMMIKIVPCHHCIATNLGLVSVTLILLFNFNIETKTIPSLFGISLSLLTVFKLAVCCSVKYQHPFFECPGRLDTGSLLEANRQYRPL